MSAKERHVGNVFTAMGNGHFASVFFQRKEGDHLIERPFGVELYLRVLVGCAERLDGRLTDVAGSSVERHVLAERFCPKLAVPVGKEFQVIRVGHHNPDVLALRHCGDLQRRASQSRVLTNGRLVADFVHIRRACKQTLDVDAKHRRRQQADGAKLRESSADAVGENIALNTAAFVGNLFEIAFLFVGGEDNVVLDVHACLCQKVEQN